MAVRVVMFMIVRVIVVVIVVSMSISMVVLMLMRVIVLMRMFMSMPVIMTMTMAMPMSMMRMPKHSQPHNIDQKAQHTNDQKLIQPPELMPLMQTVHGIHHDLNADQDKEYAVCKPRQRVHLAITIGKCERGRPLAHDGCGEPDCQAKAVEQHVYAIREEAERACYKAIEELHKHEAEIEAVVAN